MPKKNMVKKYIAEARENWAKEGFRFDETKKMSLTGRTWTFSNKEEHYENRKFTPEDKKHTKVYYSDTKFHAIYGF